MSKPKFDLEGRTAKLGESALRFVNKIPKSPLTDSLLRQLVRAATSVGAN